VLPKVRGKVIVDADARGVLPLLNLNNDRPARAARGAAQ
jgi:hypothetical protein